MPVATPQLYQYSHVAETKENLDWADRECAFLLMLTRSLKHRPLQVSLSRRQGVACQATH